MKLDGNALTVLEKRYVSRDENNKPTETVEGLFHRVAAAIAKADSVFDARADVAGTEKAFFEMMTALEFLPNSPTLMNAGKELGQLSACFVLPVEDSMEAIFEAIKQAALIHKSGGGMGFSFSRLRPAGSTVKSTGGVASGPVSFMRVFNMATEAVKQGGTRRGANMGILRVDHPDIMAFIDCKKDNADITNFNISVGITEDFMRAVEAGADYDLVDPSGKGVTGRLSARGVFEKIVNSAWANGEPGIIFLDRLNRDNVVPSQGEIESTNPCGEQPLLPYESCNLGSINLVRMLKEGKTGYAVDYEKLGETVDKAVHFLDNVIEVNRYPLDLIDAKTKATRKVGLGVMGFADMLLMLGVPYNSDEGVALGEEIMAFINETSHAASRALAAKRGAFPLFPESVYADGEPLRNATTTTIAPTGTLSIIAGCSSGVEPVFAYAFVRNVMDGTELVETNPILKDTLIRRGLYSDALMLQIIEQGSLAHIDAIPADIRRVFVCSHDISPEYHVRMQAAFQKHCDNAVSKTVNFVSGAAPADVEETYKLAYRLGCKGITIYRDGSRQGQVLNIGKTVKTAEAAEMPQAVRPRPRPESMMGLTKRVAIGCGNLYITVNYDEKGICEVFTSTGKAGGCPSQSEATARLTSIALRSGIDIDYVIKQMRGIRCPSTIRQPGMKCTSCPDAIARVIKEVDDKLKTGQFAMPGVFVPGSASTEPADTDGEEGAHCPECGEVMEHEGGCVSCRNCGFSKCN
ncbi:MAG: vitamin B12-dependent ribonucleotide reductase [Oscillospiraceae bacterium]|jgi:ribonucleoside-diphosphate reductase alpha chain|nr:vitamin B12-dependent ribonucleotide reductase [Oscillospiraceae bacterium]